VASVEKSNPAYAGQAIYGRWFLPFYDAIVYSFNQPVLWRCSEQRLIDLYDENLSGRHLDIGVATGRLLDKARFPVPDPELTLMDLNPNSLRAASRRLEHCQPRAHQANVLQPWELPPAGFDSIAMMHLLHCVPGSMAEKGVAFEHAREALAPGGVLFGVTILGRGVELSWLARRTIADNNWMGVMSNPEDDPLTLDAALGAVFPNRQVWTVGAVGFFVARGSGERAQPDLNPTFASA
jgi:SAM-dependent methyltransferase